VVRRHVAEGVSPPDAEGDLDFLPQLVGAGTVRLVDDEEVRHLHDARLQRLDPVARLRHEEEQAAVGHARHGEF
jgi:hypothetical protein